MAEKDRSNFQERLLEKKETEAEAVTSLATTGEIPCIIVYSDQKHVDYINNILNPLIELLKQKRFKPIFLSDEIKALNQYEKTFEQLVDECALGIVILDGLRPNVLLEFGILLGKNKPTIALQDEKGYVAVKGFYQGSNKQSTGLGEQIFGRFKATPSW